METFVIIAAIISAIAAIGQGISSYSSQKSANSFNESQYEDWKSYNTPAEQMKRLGEAGLNPYMVSGVNNTLSQPFAVGQNTGMAELFQGLSQRANNAAGTGLGIERNDINQQNADTKKVEAGIHQELAKLRERMVKLYEKRNEPMMALLWGQADAQTLANTMNRSSFDDIVNLRHYQSLRAQQDYDYLSSLYPMQLDFYKPLQRAKINQMLAGANLANRQASHLDWIEPFQTDQFLHNVKMDFKRFYSGQDKFFMSRDLEQDIANRRLRLSEDYLDLAKDKFYWDILSTVGSLGLKAPLKKSVKGGAGRFPEWTEYEYGF